MDTVQDNPKVVETSQNQQAGATDGKDTKVQCTSHESTNLLEKAYEEWLTHAEETDKLQTLVQKAHKKSYELQTQIQEAHKRSYAAMKTEYESALKKIQEKYNAYDTARNKARQTGNTGESETMKKMYVTTRRTIYPNRESLRRANVLGKAFVEGTKRFLVARKSVAVISSGSEDNDDNEDTVSGSEDSSDNEDNVKSEGTQNNNITV